MRAIDRLLQRWRMRRALACLPGEVRVIDIGAFHGELFEALGLACFGGMQVFQLQLAGGLFSSIFGGEGLVTRVVGHGRIVIQTRSVSGLASWINPKLR
jgi:hypothetical protein